MYSTLCNIHTSFILKVCNCRKQLSITHVVNIVVRYTIIRTNIDLCILKFNLIVVV